MGVKRIALFLLLIFVSGCSLIRQQEIIKIALLAPFEGRYREIGYDALYAARLAITDSGYDHIDLLAIDDGGSIETALARAQAIRKDSAIKLTLVLGLQASDAQVQSEFGEHPVIIIGHWNSQPDGANVVMLASAEIDSLLSENQPESVTSTPTTPFFGSELFALKQVPMLHDALSEITIFSSATLPDTDFIERYVSSDSFVPQPGLLTTLAYDATGLAIESIIAGTSLREIEYEGINGSIQFDENGYWLDAPVYEYRYENQQLSLKS